MQKKAEKDLSIFQKDKVITEIDRGENIQKGINWWLLSNFEALVMQWSICLKMKLLMYKYKDIGEDIWTKIKIYGKKYEPLIR